MPALPRLAALFGPAPGGREARAFSSLALIAAVLACTVGVYRGFQGETFLGRSLGGDFVAFYAAGKILNEHEPARIYDLELFDRVMHESVPTMAKNETMPFMHGPFIAQVYRPFALLPYRWSYVAWLVFSPLLFLMSLWLLKPAGMTHSETGAALLLALSTPVYSFETWIGGQVSILALAAIALFVHCQWRRRFFAAGLCLALVAYKPTLLFLPVVVLLAGRAWRTLAGVSAGLVTVASLSWVTVGREGIEGWLRMLQLGRIFAMSPHAILRRDKYIDINSFLQIVSGGGGIATLLAVLLIAGSALWLAYRWWRPTEKSREERELLWAATFAWMLVLNLYVPIYDSLMLLPALALAVQALGRSAVKVEQMQWWTTLFYLLSWLTQLAAEFARVQFFTVAIAAFAIWIMKKAEEREQVLAETREESTQTVTARF